MSYICILLQTTSNSENLLLLEEVVITDNFY